MASKTSIVNLALTHLGTNKYIANVDTERSAEAITAKNVYDTALDVVLQAWNWGFARKYATLALVSEDTSNGAIWRYSYRYPTGCTKIRRLVPDSATFSYPHTLELPYELGIDDQGRLIYTNVQDAVIEYTASVTDVNHMPAEFHLAFSYYLAHLMAPAITAGDQFGLGDKALQLYMNAIENAKYGSNLEEHAKTPHADEVSEYSLSRT